MTRRILIGSYCGIPGGNVADSIAKVGICSHCKERHRLDAEGLIEYHSWPPPTRMVCRGAKKKPA